MTEREKMLAGELYDCGDAELLDRWHLAKDLAAAYNRTPSADLAEKDRILARLTSYRKIHGLGCLRQVAELAGKPLTEEILRMTLLGEVKQPLEVWKQIDRALDALEQEGGHE